LTDFNIENYLTTLRWQQRKTTFSFFVCLSRWTDTTEKTAANIALPLFWLKLWIW
jgi:hypothetical protein